MSAENYAEFQRFQSALAELMADSLDTVEGNELFQRVTDAAFEFFKCRSTAPNA